MGAREKWVFKDGDKYIEREENDGWTFMRRGPEAHDRELTDKEIIQYLEGRLRNEIKLTATLRKG